MAERSPQFTPVTLLTGFLGSGKTTLLQRLLADPALADTAVLINEFGEVGLDHHLLERIDERIVLLQSGCLCCTVRGELAEAVQHLHSRRTRGTIPSFRRMVIESTGLADPFPVLTTFHADPVLKHHFRMAGVVTTVDAVNGARHLAQYPESVKQVAVADRIVIAKADLADAATAASLERRVRTINPAASLLHGADVPSLAGWILAEPAAATIGRDPAAQAWFAEELRAAGRDEDGGIATGRHGDIHAFAIVLERPLDWTAFGLWLTMLLHRHGNDVLRVKGILNVTGSDAPVAVHGVQQLVHPPIHMSAWPDADRRSRLVFIVKGLDGGAIKRSLAVFCGLAVAEPALAGP